MTGIYGERALNVRPGLIVGPHDPDRPFRLLGGALRAGRSSWATGAAEAIVPLPAERPLQLIDARDLAAFMLDLVAGKASGTFNATSPRGPMDVRRAGQALSRRSRAARRHDRRGSTRRCSWSRRSRRGPGCRCGFPRTFADEAGFMEIDCGKAQRAGLRTRPLAETVADTAAWLAQRDNASAWKDVLTADAERELVKARGPVH